MKTVRSLDRASEVLLILLVAATPLAFGSVEVWATEGMKAGILLFVLLRVTRRIVAGPEGHPWGLFRATGVPIPVALFLALVLFQIVPLPAGVIGLVSPRTDALYRETLPGYPGRQDLSRIEGFLLEDDAAPPLAVAGADVSVPAPRGHRTLSVYPYGTRVRISLLVSYLLLFFAAAEFAREPARRVRLLIAVTLVGFGISAFALVQKMTWNGKIFWLREASASTRPFGPFVNPNHFAGYMELVLPVSLGLLLTVWRMRNTGERSGAEPTKVGDGIISFNRLEPTRREMFAGWGEAALAKTAVFGCAMFLAVLAILLCGSRGGLISTAITFALFGGLLVPAGVRRRAMIVAPIVAVAIIVAVVLASLGFSPLSGPLTRLAAAGAEPDFATRWNAWGATLRLIGDHPVIGTGLGTYREAYAAYYPPAVTSIWDKAHNDYLEILSDTGVAGGLLVLLGVGLFARRVLLPALRAARERELRLGLAMALVSIALHSFVDFNLQIPSNGMLAVLLAGVLAAMVLAPRGGARNRTSRSNPAGSSRLEGGQAQPDAVGAMRPATVAIGLVLVGLVTWSTAVSAARFTGDRHFSRGESFVEGLRIDDAIAEYERALESDPGRSETYQRLGDRLQEAWEDLPPVGYPQSEQGASGGKPSLLQRAVSAYLGGIDASPGDSLCWAGLGGVYAHIALQPRGPGVIDLRRFTAPAPSELAPESRVALAALDRAISLEPDGFEHRDAKAGLLLEVGQVKEGLEEYTRSAAIMPVHWRHLWNRPQDMTPEMMQAITTGFDRAMNEGRVIPPHETLRSLGEMLGARGDYAASERCFERALETARDDTTRLVLRFQLGQTQRKLGKITEAIESFKAAIEEPAVEAYARWNLAEIALESGEAEDAFLQMRQAVILKPRSTALRLTFARAAEATGRLDQAEDALQQAASIAPNDPEPLTRLVDLYRGRGDLGRATAATRRLVDRWPQVASYRKMLDDLLPEAR